MLITTGDSGKGQFFNDVWSFDLASDSWSEVSVSGDIPRKRYGSAGGIFEEGGQLYVTHGFSNQGRFDDTWLFDLATTTLQDVTPQGSLPLQRCLHAAALISPSSLILFGGCSSGFGPCPQGDTWHFDRQAGSWQEIGLSEHPSPRQHPGLVALVRSGAALLFGRVAEGQANQNDIWHINAARTSWTKLQPQNTAPSPRNGHSIVWHGAGVIVFGGHELGNRPYLWGLFGLRDALTR